MKLGWLFVLALALTWVAGNQGGAAAATTTSYNVSAGPIAFKGHKLTLTARLDPGSAVFLTVALEKKTPGQTQFHRWFFTLIPSVFKVDAALGTATFDTSTRLGAFGQVKLTFSATNAAKTVRSKCATTRTRPGRAVGTLRFVTGVPEFGTAVKAVLPASLASVATDNDCTPRAVCEYGTRLDITGRGGVFASALRSRRVAYQVAQDTTKGPATIVHGVNGTTSAGALATKTDLSTGKLTLQGVPHLKGYLMLAATTSLVTTTGTCGTLKSRLVKLGGPGITVDPDAGPTFKFKGAGTGFVSQLTK